MLGLEQRNKSRKSRNLSCKKRLEVFMKAKHWQEHKSANKCKSKSTNLNSCKYCKETFLSSKLLKNHRKTHKPNELLHIDRDEPDYKFDVCQDLYICNVCSAEFQEETEAKLHTQSHKEVIFCLVCKKTFSSHYDLGIHSITHDPERKVKCPLCSYVSKNANPYSFKAHMNFVHLKKFPFYCKECGKGFKHFKTYHEHQNTHEGKKPYVCVVCEKGFAYQKYLQVHQVRSHQVGTTGQKIENKCTTCNRYFYKPEALAEHIEVCYKRKKKPKSTSPAKAFLCDTCGQTFTEKSKLLEHLRVHKGDFPYVCTWCGKRFPVKSYLKTHERVHTGEKPYSCEFCGRRFGQHAPFRVHRRLHTGERPYVCDFCSKGFTTNQGLKLHKKNCPDNQLNKMLKIDKMVASSTDSNVSSQHSIFGLFQYYLIRKYLMRLRRQPKGQSIENSDRDYEYTAIRRSSSGRPNLESRQCDRCFKKFKLKKSWLKHQCPLATKIDINWACKYCSESFSTRRLLRVHQKSHKANYFKEEDPSYKFDVVQDLYICEVCSAEFQKVNEVQAHIKSHLPELKCDLCEKLFESAFNLGLHSVQHSTDKKIKCPFCTYVSKSSNPYSFKSHMNYIHLKKFPFYCKQCGQGFKQFKIYQDHENSHSGRKPYVCVVCNKSFTFEKYLIVHQTRTHQVSSGDSNIQRRCKKCQRVFRNFEALNEHCESCVKKKTALKKPISFLCDTCGQGFIEKAKLLKHIRVHKGDLPFVCTWCDKRFPQKDYLKTHERVHTREKPYTCHFCGKCFGFHAPFKVHIRTHTGERPYKCDSCSKGFTTNQGLKLHRKNCRMIN